MENESSSLREVRFEYTERFPEILNELGCSLLVSTYQAGKVMVVGATEDGLEVSFLEFEHPMGIAAKDGRIAIGTRRGIQFWGVVKGGDDGRGIVACRVTDGEVSQDRLQNEGVGGGADARSRSERPRSSERPRGEPAFIGLNSHFTGDIHGHDLAWGAEGLWIVNTMFSALCTLSEGYSFVPRWQPAFVTALDDRDRCHLNGLAMENGKPRFMTALAASNEPAGWREQKLDGGCVIDVANGETVACGLCMPHSPRMHGDQLWVLNSGRGELCVVETESGKVEPVQFMPGFLRGLAFAERFAFVGLSRARESNLFGGLPILERVDEMRCGIGIVDLVSGKTIAVLKFHDVITEIFAVEVLPNTRNPLFAGSILGNSEREIWVIPESNC